MVCFISLSLWQNSLLTHNSEQAKSFRCWNLRTSSLRSSEFLFRASERLLRTSFQSFSGKRCNLRRPDTYHRVYSPQNLYGFLHLCRFHLWYGVRVISAMSQPYGTVTATHVSDVGGARRQSCVTTFTRGKNLMLLGTWKRLNGRFISAPSLRIPNFIRFTLKPFPLLTLFL